MSNTLDTAKDNEQSHRGQSASHPYWRPTKSLLHSTTDRICLNGVVGESELERDKDSKQDRHPSSMQSTLDIIGRAANKRVFVFLLIQLRQRRLYESRGRANQCDNPHPEHRTWSTDSDGRGHPCKIARTHTSGYRHRKSLK